MAFAIEPLAGRGLAAYGAWRPLDIGPYRSVLFVTPGLIALRIHAVATPFKKGFQELHHWPGFHKTPIGVLYGPPAWPEIHEYFQ